MVRGEVGARFDHIVPLDDDGTVLNLNGRLAYARDWTSDPAVTASFQALPGAGFTVNSAALPKHVGLAALGVELCLEDGVSVSGRFEGEFAPGYINYGGMGTIRASW
jgi:uncharacterized protein with beta-barrel porin domain